MERKFKVLELFGGIGACSKALERLNIEHEVVDYVEIDKYAVKSFNAIHNTNFEPQDIIQWDKDIEVDLIMHGSPCQDFSLAGKQAGGDLGSGTRSSLLYETIRIVSNLKPKYVIWENVKNVLSQKHRHNFDNYLSEMEKLGYTNYYQVLNAKDYGIPQNRERVFTISILYNYTEKYEKISVIEKDFKFPPKQDLKLKLKDMLEDEVDEKYYLSDKMIKYISATGTANFKNPDSKINLDIARPLTTDQNKRAGTTNYLSTDLPDNYNLNEVVRKYGVFDTEKSKHQAGSVYDENGLYPTLDTMQGEYRQPCIEIKEATKKGYKEAYEGDGVYINRPHQKRGVVQKGKIQTLKTSCNDVGVVVKNKRLQSLIDKTTFKEGQVLNMDLYNQTTNENISQCLTEPNHNTHRLFDGLRIRKLIPREAFRLMGFDDEDFEKASKVNSNTQLYKQAGNSICVNVLEAILKKLL